MIQKIGIILIVMLLITASLQFIIPFDSNVHADPGGDDEGSEYYLDFDYFWNVTTHLANIVYTSYEGTDIVKGRFFGSDGDLDTAFYLRDELRDNCSYNNSRKVQLGPLPTSMKIKSWRPHPWFNYTELVEPTSYELTINHPDYRTETGSTAKTIPQNNTYPLVATRRQIDGFNDNFTLRRDFNQVMVINKNDFITNYPLYNRGLNPHNTTYAQTNDYDVIFGNITYIAPGEQIPENHPYQTVFLLEEVNGCDSQIDNATNASGIILINNNSAATLEYQDSESYQIPIQRVDTTNESNNDTINTVKEMLQNGTLVRADNQIYEDNLTFVHNLSSPLCRPENNFTILYNLTGGNLLNIVFHIMIMRANNIWHHMKGDSEGFCRCILILDNITEQCHNMHIPVINNMRFVGKIFPNFALPGFAIERKTGWFLWRHSNDENNTISGHLQQIHLKETQSSWGATAHNVEAYLNISHSPNDKRVICANRYDSM